MPDPFRRDFAMAVLDRASRVIEATPEVAARAESFIRSGAAPLDAQTGRLLQGRTWNQMPALALAGTP